MAIRGKRGARQMQKIIYFDIAAIAVLITLLIGTFTHKLYKGPAKRWFIFNVFEALLTAVFSGLSIFFDNLGAGHIAAKWVTHGVYLALHTLTALFYVLYLVALTDTWHKFRKKRWKKLLLFLPCGIYLVKLTLSFLPGIPKIFYIDEATGAYTRNLPFFFLGYLVGGYYLLYGLVYLIRYHRLFAESNLISLFSFYPLIFCAMLIEFLFPTVIIELFANALTYIYIFLTVQRNEEQLDFSTGLLNFATYQKNLRKGFLNEKPMREIFIAQRNYNEVRELLGYDLHSAFLRFLADRIRRVCAEEKLRAELFYGRYGRFHLLVAEEQFAAVSHAAARFYRELNGNIVFRGNEILLQTGVCVIRIPEDVGSVDASSVFLSVIQDGEHYDSEIYASDLVNTKEYGMLLNIDRILESAMEEHRFSVYYQPILEVRENRYLAAEALLRLKDPQYGFISPAVFIPAAERSGFIRRLGPFVLEEVCRFISGGQFAALGLEYLEVNLSVSQCVDEGLADGVIGILRKYKVSPRTINLEVTEGAVAVSRRIAEENLRRISAAGIGISIDDYGTGYSNIQRMTTLPVSIVKFDKSMIDGFDSERMRTVIEGTVHMLQKLGIRSVAEGVETAERAAQIVDVGCDFIQGFYYSRPLPEKEFVSFLQKNLEKETPENRKTPASV